MLGEILKKNKSLSLLDISYNDLFTKDCTMLGEVLRVNSTLTRISVKGNEIHDCNLQTQN